MTFGLARMLVLTEKYLGVPKAKANMPKKVLSKSQQLSVQALISFAAAQNSMSAESVTDCVLTTFNTQGIEQIDAERYEEVVIYLADFDKQRLN